MAVEPRHRHIPDELGDRVGPVGPVSRRDEQACACPGEHRCRLVRAEARVERDEDRPHLGHGGEERDRVQRGARPPGDAVTVGHTCRAQRMSDAIRGPVHLAERQGAPAQ